MQAGKLKHRVDVDVRNQTQDQTTGDPVVTWTNMGTLWGEVEPLSMREILGQGELLMGQADTRFRFRYGPLSSLITAGHRLRHQGTSFDVLGARNVHLDQRVIEVVAKSGTNDG